MPLCSIHGDRNARTLPTIKGNTMGQNAASLASTKSSNTGPEPMMDMNMTPLIDVMLVLIIMLIITIPRQNHSTSLPLQGSPNTSEVKPLTINLDVDFDGTVTVDGVVMGTRAQLTAKLAAIAASAVPSELHVRANKLASYKYVAGVMAAAQRAGVKSIGLVGNEQLM